MFKYFQLPVWLFLILNSCSTKQIPGYLNQKSINSTNIVASVQPLNYPWNTEGHLVDLIRKEYDIDPPFFSPFNILLSFENIEPDTFSIYICLILEESCVNIGEQFFDGGLYSLGFQKLKVENGMYGIKIIGNDVEYYQQYFLPSF